jgi:auxin efflux carrier family protein
MPFFSAPTSFRNANAAPFSILQPFEFSPSPEFTVLRKAPSHSSHPAIGHLILLVFEAVLEVVCVSLPGYIVARQGMFDAESQKFVANLNVALFTPCLSKFAVPPPVSS